MSKNRPIKDEIKRAATENVRFIINVTETYNNELEYLFANDVRWSRVRQLGQERGNSFMEAPLIAGSCLMYVMDLYSVAYSNVRETFYANGAIIPDGDFSIDDELYQVKSSFRYCSNQQKQRSDGVYINHYIGSMCVKQPQNTEMIKFKIYYYGVMNASQLNFRNPKTGQKWKTAQMWPSDFGDFPDAFEPIVDEYSIII